MPRNFRQLQPLLGASTMGLALGVFAGTWWVSLGPPPEHALAAGGLAATLTIALVAVQWFPIHIRQNGKMHLGTVVVYLMAVLLPPALAMTAVLVGMGIGELSLRRERGGRYCDVATQVGRTMLFVVPGSLVAHLPVHDSSLASITLLAAALVLWLGEFLTYPLLLSPITGEPPQLVLVSAIRSAGLLEGAQYLVGILGAVAASQEHWTVLLLALPSVLVYSTAKHAKELQDHTRELLERMADTVDLRDPYTGGHSRRVTKYVAGILHELGKTGPDVRLIVSAARVHDIGKIGIPDEVLRKEDTLTEEEWAMMQSHPELGAELLQRYPDFARGAEMVRHHHERWDGQGYPHRLRETAIPFGARVIAVADSYDAMTSDRPYRLGMAAQQAAAILREGRGRQWEGVIVDAFLRSMADRLEEPVRSTLRLVPDPRAAGQAVGTA